MLAKTESTSIRIKRYALLIAVAWTFVIATLLLYQVHQVQQMTQDLAKTEARALFNKDQAFRLWATSHGGVYVPTNERTPPNPNLSHVPERDIQTPSGKKLTLMNPAYMLRQINEDFAELYGIMGHITGLKLLRADNAPDEWERAALVAFERGETEVSELTQIDGEPYLRLMRPMFMQKPCLKCHGHLGYKIGDVRGGVSISLPMKEYFENQHKIIMLSTISLSVLWILGIGGLSMGTRSLQRHVQERFAAEKESRQAKQIIEDSPNILFKWKAKDRWPVAYVTDNVTQLGYSRQAFLDGTILFAEIIHPDDLQTLTEEVQYYSENRIDHFKQEYRIFDKEGKVRWIDDWTIIVRDEADNIAYYYGIITDVSQRHCAEEKLKESEQRWQFALEGSQDGVWDWNIVTNQVYFSSAWKRMLGYEDHEIASDFREWDKRVHPDDREQSYRNVNKHLAGESEYYQNEHRLRCKDGRYKWILARGKIFEWTDDGKPLRFIGTHTDISEHKRAEEVLKKAKEEAQLANRAKSEFLTNMSHEIRTPLNAILGFTQVLLSQFTDDSKQKNSLDAISQAGNSLLTLVDDILDLSKIEAGQLEIQYKAINLSMIFNELKQIFALKLSDKNLAFVVEIDQALPLMLDERRLRQVLLNIVGNAIKFTEKGTIKLTAQADKHDKIDLIISVADTGIGIPENQQEMIFESFQQQDGQSTRKYGGTGLGLALSKRLVKMMNGDISVKSKVGVGSIFKITLADVEVPEQLGTQMSIVEENAQVLDDVQLDTNLSPENLAKLPELCGILEERMMPLWQEMNGAIDMNEIDDFAEKVKNLGADYKVPGLIHYAENLRESAQTFDFNNIENSLKAFPTMVKELGAMPLS
jgi:PAS domain S-box-containing protein